MAEDWRDRLPDSRNPVSGTTRERRSRRMIERITQAILAREETIDGNGVFSQILLIVKFRRDTDRIERVQIRYHDDDGD